MGTKPKNKGMFLKSVYPHSIFYSTLWVRESIMYSFKSLRLLLEDVCISWCCWMNLMLVVCSCISWVRGSGKCIPWMHWKLLWMKASGKCINVDLANALSAHCSAYELRAASSHASCLLNKNLTFCTKYLLKSSYYRHLFYTCIFTWHQVSHFSWQFLQLNRFRTDFYVSF